MLQDGETGTYCQTPVSTCTNTRRYVREDNLVAVLRKRAQRSKRVTGPVVLNRMR
jgi:hypothetical protein